MDNMEHQHSDENKGFWTTKIGIVTIGFLAIFAFFLIQEHWAHLFVYWPFLFLLACPLMHLFMHHGNNDGKK